MEKRVQKKKAKSGVNPQSMLKIQANPYNLTPHSATLVGLINNKIVFRQSFFLFIMKMLYRTNKVNYCKIPKVSPGFKNQHSVLVSDIQIGN